MEGASCVVRIRTDARFSDGSPVTAQDAAYSLQLAQASPRFAAQLAGVAEVATPDRYTIVFTLAAPDQYFPRSLCFPIVGEGTGEDPLPLGGGRFVLDDSGTAMSRSGSYHTPVQNLRTVRLIDAGPLADQGAAVLAGELDLFYSDLRGTADLSLGLSRRQVVLSNLVYLGVNSQRRGWPAELRTAFSGIIDRDALARRAYLGFAAPAYSPIKQSFSMAAAGEEDPEPDPQEELLDALGYGERDAEGWRTYQRRRFTVRLLVNSGSPHRLEAAALIAQDLAGAGIQVVVEEAPFEEYSQRIAMGDYDLYLGELRIPWNLDLTPLIAPSETVGPGCVRDPELLEIYRQVKAGEAELSALDSALRRTMPMIPLLYRRGIVAFSPDFSANIVATEQDIFYNIGEW